MSKLMKNMKNKHLFIAISLIIITTVTISTYVIYKKLKKIQNVSQDQTKQLYFDELPGIKISSPISRKKFINKLNTNIKGFMLEIGPYHSPVLTGENVFYFDIFDSKTLREKAINNLNMTDANVPEKIHYVDPFGDLNIVDKKFQLVFSAHNIEHQIDLVQHLLDVEKLLDKGGKYYLVIPDKRYCFDHFIGLTPISEVLATHWQKPKRHSLQTVLSKCEATHNYPARHWKNEDGLPTFTYDKDCFESKRKMFFASNEYIDTHKWRFTPESFGGIINTLNEMNLISLSVEKIYDTQKDTFEFFVVLTKN